MWGSVVSRDWVALEAAVNTGKVLFAQLTLRESLCDIDAYLGAQPAKLYHLEFRASALCLLAGGN
jgi:hypothetical protein